MRILPLIPLLLVVGCDQKQPWEQQVKRLVSKDERARQTRLRSELEGKPLYGPTKEDAAIHLRMDCPQIPAPKNGTSKLEALKSFWIKQGRIEDVDGFFHDSRPFCERCIP